MNILKIHGWSSLTRIIILAFLGSQLVSCTIYNGEMELSLSGISGIKWISIVDLKQDTKRYYLHWHGIIREVHYPLLTEDAFYARLWSSEDFPESIRSYLDLPRESKIPETCSEVHIRIRDKAKNPFADHIEIPYQLIKSIRLTDREKQDNPKTVEPNSQKLSDNR